MIGRGKLEFIDGYPTILDLDKSKKANPKTE